MVAGTLFMTTLETKKNVGMSVALTQVDSEPITGLASELLKRLTTRTEFLNRKKCRAKTVRNGGRYAFYDNFGD